MTLPENASANLPARMPKASKPNTKPTIKPAELQSNEHIVWKNISTKGFWHRRIVQALELTNLGIIVNDSQSCFK
jgi:hypothetical protein